ncbi:hypothetical protein B0H19DRAFT_1167168 [Mycena capillaripes]|nr:hypothetical protein B0H19DRAFT_1167168 [Mycena capillaripes]
MYSDCAIARIHPERMSSPKFDDMMYPNQYVIPRGRFECNLSRGREDRKRRRIHQKADRHR